MLTLGALRLQPALERPDLLAGPVAAALRLLPGAEEALVAEIDPGLADTAAMTEAYDVPLEASANCVLVQGRRGGEERVAACVVLATTRADVNRLAKRTLDVRKLSFLPADDAVGRTGMQYGGITPIGLPESWTLLIDAAVAALEVVVIGSGLRCGKIVARGSLVGRVPGAMIIEHLGVPVER